MHAALETNATLRSTTTATPVAASVVPSASATAANKTMRAIVHPEYGTPDVLRLEEIERPMAGEGEVLVRVHAAGASIGDHHIVTGKPYLVRLTPFGGLPRPKNRVPGTAIAGCIEALGPNVVGFHVGDEVFGEAMNGAFAEYAVVAATRIAPKPKNLSWQETAATPWASTALQALRDAGGLKPGQKVLIYGASGGVGGWAVQIAKAMGAEVTAVCSTRNVERVRALGATHVIDYTQEDFAQGGARFDLMLDLVGNRSLSECKAALLPKGTYVSCSAGGGDWFGPLLWLAGMFIRSMFSSQKLTAFMNSPNHADFVALKDLIETGKIKPVIEQVLPLSDVAVALRHVGAGHSQGQTVIQIAE